MQRIRNIPWPIIPDWILGNRLKILMYHSISENPRDPHAISPAEFKRQMISLQTSRVISLSESLNYLKDKQSLKNVWVITFDDGLLDFYKNALPIVRELDYPVTMFLPTGLVGKSAVWDSFDKTKPLINWQQLEECQKWNITFGSHTINHVRLTECDDGNLINELRISLQILQKRLDHVIPALAYPGGYQDARVRQAVRSTGYCCALGGSSHWGNGSESDLFQLRRERINQ